MAARWSSQQMVAEHKDLQANVMAVDCLGQWTLLAGRRSLALVDLNNPVQNVKKISRQSKWDVSCVQWNPHPSHANLCATACSQRVDVSSWVDATRQPFCSLKAHTRVISDIDWSLFDENVIATCSVDTFTYLWDVRDPKKPSSSFQTVAGASQVQWNKLTSEKFATTHEGDVRIWDTRKGNTPYQYIAAHLSKIHGLDWSPTTRDHLATSSQDSTVAIWDVTSPRKAIISLQSRSPVWRARYTPFGMGLVTVVVPQLRRGENSLYLWNISTLMQPVHTFVGHTDVVLEFQWRKQQEGDKDYQLVTWSKDQTLRIWKIDQQLQRLCKDDNFDDLEDDSLAVTESTEVISAVPSEVKEPTISPVSDTSILTTGTRSASLSFNQHVQTLQQEFSLVNTNIPNVNVEMNLGARTCQVKTVSRKQNLTLVIQFPPQYPFNAAPTFEFIDSDSVDGSTKSKVLKVLQDTSYNHVKRNRSCLAPCLTHLVNTLDSFEERKSPDTDTPFNLQQAPSALQSFMPSMINFGVFLDSSIPFPRTSGARFCSTGFLVCFGRPPGVKKVYDYDKTPKALSALAAFAQTASTRPPQVAAPFAHAMTGNFTMYSRSPPSSMQEMSISNFFTYKGDKQKQRTRAKSRIKDVQEFKAKEKRTQDKEKLSLKKKVSPVKIYDMNSLLTIHRQLGENYIFDVNDIPRMCTHNAAAAAMLGRKDLVQLWSLLSLMSSPNLAPCENPDKGPPWAHYPFGRAMLKSLMDHYMSIHDVQTLAMLCCLFWQRDDVPKDHGQSASNKSIEYLPPMIHTSLSNPMGESTDSYSGWKLLLQAPAARRMSMFTAPVLTEVASQSNIAHMLQSAVIKMKRSNSWSDSFEDYRFVDDLRDPKEKALEDEREKHADNCRLLDPANYRLYDQFKKVYANILYRWQLKNQSAEILQFVTEVPDTHKGIDFGVVCHYCGSENRGPNCGSCKNIPFQCIICHTGVKGASNFCLTCGHGGHTNHMRDWFLHERECPSGCGCICLDETPSITDYELISVS